jgi:hypothetical protein
MVSAPSASSGPGDPDPARELSIVDRSVAHGFAARRDLTHLATRNRNLPDTRRSREIIMGEVQRAAPAGD